MKLSAWSVGLAFLGLFGGTEAALAQATFSIPPRSVADIAAVLDQYKPDPAKLAAIRARADAVPPPGLSARPLADFLIDRSQAAGQLGRQAQALADAREAVRLATESSHPNLNRIMGILATAESIAGNVRTSHEIIQARIKNALTPGQRITSRMDQASSLLRLGALDEAVKHLDFAESITNEGGFFSDPDRAASKGNYQGTFFRLRASIALEAGRLDDAERFARRALAQTAIDRKDRNLHRAVASVGITPASIESDYIIRALALTQILMRQGKLVEAEAEVRRALVEALQIFGRYSLQGAGSALQLARVLYEQGRYRDAATLADIAIDAYRNLGAGEGSVTLAQALTFKGRIQGRLGDPMAAIASFQEANKILAGDEPLRRRYIEGDASYGVALLDSGDAATAVTVFENLANARRAQFGDRHAQTAQARALLANALAKTGDVTRSLAEFKAAVPIMLQASRDSDDDAGAADADRRLQIILEVYIDLLSRVTGQADIDAGAEAFLAADAARARGVQRALAASAARTSIADPALARLVRDEQDARKQISAQFGLLATILARPPEQQDAAATATLRTSIDKLRDSRAALRADIEKRFPDYASLIDPRPVAAADTQNLLRPGEALLSVYLGAERSYV